MPSNITPVSAWTTPLTGPANGDPVDGGTGGAPFDMGQKLANRVEFLKDHVIGAESQTVSFPLVVQPQGTVRWEFGLIPAGAAALHQNSAATAWGVWVELPQPRAGTLTALAAILLGDPGTHAGLPGTMPTLTLFRQSGTGAPVSVATVTDTSASVAVYEAVHLLSLTGISETLDTTSPTRYYAYITGEAGANSQLNLALVSLYGVVDP